MQVVFLCDKNHRNRKRAKKKIKKKKKTQKPKKKKKKNKKIPASQSKYCEGCRLIENARLVSFALILSGMFRASQIEKLWKWIILRHACETCVLKLNAFVRQTYQQQKK